MERMYRRRNYFIDKKFQTKFIIKFSLIVLIASALIGALLLYLAKDSTTVTIENTKVMVKRTPDFIFPIILETIVIVSIFSALAVIILTLLTSHKIAGPLFRIQKELELIKQGSLTPTFRIRRSDQLQELARSLSDVVTLLRNKHNSLKEKNLELKNILDASASNKAAIQTILKDMDNIINYFKV
jgi:methyl-accepting chemotaxis protein